jgi:hypothetical protein
VSDSKRVIILGAGASKSYNGSKTGVRMPVALDFFETFRKLDISHNPWVLIGNIITYIAERNNREVLDFLQFSQDIEVLHSEIQEKLYDALKNDNFFSGDSDVRLLRAYVELIFLFVSVINEIQNGTTSASHINLAQQLTPADSIITFNWDTLMDRALKDTSNWKPGDGYVVRPTSIFKDQWERNELKRETGDFTKIIKLHGSTNWLTSYFQPGAGGRLELSQETREDDFYVYEHATKPYSTFAGRFMEGYAKFSYGYYPPNLPLKGKSAPEGSVFVKSKLKLPTMPEGKSSEEGLVSMPLIIPPVKSKEYGLFGSLFLSLWQAAEKELQMADTIYIIGYSFPKTDIRTDGLFRSAFIKRNTIPSIVILNPNPDSIVARFIYDYGIPENMITIQQDFFSDTYKL